MLEQDLFPPVRDWLRAKGLKVYTEVPYYDRSIDVIGVGKRDLWAVELKTCMTHKVVHQGCQAQLFSRRSYCAVGTRPRSLDRAKQLGLGVLSVSDGVVTEVLAPDSKCTLVSSIVKRVRERCEGPESDAPGGVPNMLGIGPAQQCLAAVKSYRAEHPHASWREIYAAVPNHYTSFRSMQGAMSKMDDLLAARAKARSARDQVRAFIAHNAGATWREIFDGTDTGYSCPASLRAVLADRFRPLYKTIEQAKWERLAACGATGSLDDD